MRDNRRCRSPTSRTPTQTPSTLFLPLRLQSRIPAFVSESAQSSRTLITKSGKKKHSVRYLDNLTTGDSTPAYLNFYQKCQDIKEEPEQPDIRSHIYKKYQERASGGPNGPPIQKKEHPKTYQTYEDIKVEVGGTNETFVLKEVGDHLEQSSGSSSSRSTGGKKHEKKPPKILKIREISSPVNNKVVITRKKVCVSRGCSALDFLSLPQYDDEINNFTQSVTLPYMTRMSRLCQRADSTLFRTPSPISTQQFRVQATQLSTMTICSKVSRLATVCESEDSLKSSSLNAIVDTVSAKCINDLRVTHSASTLNFPSEYSLGENNMAEAEPPMSSERPRKSKVKIIEQEVDTKVATVVRPMMDPIVEASGPVVKKQKFYIENDLLRPTPNVNLRKAIPQILQDMRHVARCLPAMGGIGITTPSRAPLPIRRPPSWSDLQKQGISVYGVPYTPLYKWKKKNLPDSKAKCHKIILQQQADFLRGRIRYVRSSPTGIMLELPGAVDFVSNSNVVSCTSSSAADNSRYDSQRYMMRQMTSYDSAFFEMTEDERERSIKKAKKELIKQRKQAANENSKTRTKGVQVRGSQMVPIKKDVEEGRVFPNGRKKEMEELYQSITKDILY